MKRLSAEYRLSQRWFPRGAMAVTHPEGLGVAYVAPWDNSGRWQVVAYRGSSGKRDFNFTYKNRAAAEEKVKSWFESLGAHREMIQNRRADYGKPHNLKVGDVITNSWGYDQTNVDWYRVARTSTHYVWLKPIAANVQETGFMSGSSTPHVDTSNPDSSQWGFRDLDKPEEKHKATSGTYGDSVTFEFGSGSKWDGKEKYASWYA